MGKLIGTYLIMRLVCQGPLRHLKEALGPCKVTWGMCTPADRKNDTYPPQVTVKPTYIFPGAPFFSPDPSRWSELNFAVFRRLLAYRKQKLRPEVETGSEAIFPRFPPNYVGAEATHVHICSVFCYRSARAGPRLD